MINKFLLSVLLTFLSIYASFSQVNTQSNQQDFYEIKIYHLEDSLQENKVDIFLKEAYIPALNRAGIKNVGVFKPVEKDSLGENKIYVFIPYAFFQEFLKLPEVLEQDRIFKETGNSYIDASYDNPPFSRLESILLQAFSGSTTYQKSDLTNEISERVYELRSYESSTEALNINKVAMFNSAEIGLFKRLDFNTIFYAEVLAGSNMPNLMYMTSFSNMESRDAHWKTFGEDSQWKELSGRKEYQNNVSHADIILLHPTEYSQL